MICPHCLETIDDDATVCPYCHEAVDEGAAQLHVVFCEGCGARLSPHDRTCPKCGRPAPGILSTGASASDLAAGKTASFPRLTQAAIETDLPTPEPVKAQRVIDDSLDASATTVLDANELEKRSEDSKGSKKRNRDIDPYHTRKRPVKAIVLTVVIVLIIVGGAAFVKFDPFGVMPGFYAYIETSASEMFPSREGMGSSTTDGTDDATDDADGSDDATAEDEVLSDDAAFEELSDAYDTIVSINGSERFQDVIDSFNSSYLSSSLAAREQASEGAYALRDELQDVIDELDGMKLADDSVYLEDQGNVSQLAEWMYERVNVICESWDISLSYPDGEQMSDHQSEILEPMREAGDTALDNFYEYVYDWEPTEK